MRASHERCARCDVWSVLTAGIHKGTLGECRREAPRIDFTKKDNAGRGIFPLTRKDDWCGRYVSEPVMPC